MAYVISANYRDRSSKYRWLIRELGQDPSAALACKSVKAKGVRFADSDKIEEGFGCKIVAIAEEAEGYDFEPLEPVGMPLRFDGAYFRDPEDKKVESCENLDLSESGAILASGEVKRKSS